MKIFQTLCVLAVALTAMTMASCSSNPAHGVGSVTKSVYESNGMRFEVKREMISATPPAYVTQTTQL
jgi:predicted small secreted protein